MTDPQGLRERKKRRTRATIVDAAADLCLRQGFDKTTVDQIAAAADVAPRTFSRYFPSKGAVIAAIADDVDAYVADALAAQPPDINEHEALLRAHLAIFDPSGPYAPLAFNRMAVLIQIVNASPTLNATAFAFQQGHARQAVAVIADRMGLAPDDVAVRLVADTWTSVYAAALKGMGVPGGDPVEAPILRARMAAVFETFTRTWKPWRSPDPTNG